MSCWHALFARLTDELLRDAGKPQRYGSKAKILNGKLVFDPIEDSIHLEGAEGSSA